MCVNPTCVNPMYVCQPAPPPHHNTVALLALPLRLLRQLIAELTGGGLLRLERGARLRLLLVSTPDNFHFT